MHHYYLVECLLRMLAQLHHWTFVRPGRIIIDGPPIAHVVPSAPRSIPVNINPVPIRGLW